MELVSTFLKLFLVTNHLVSLSLALNHGKEFIALRLCSSLQYLLLVFELLLTSRVQVVYHPLLFLKQYLLAHLRLLLAVMVRP